MTGETVITLCMREASGSHVPKYPRGPEQALHTRGTRQGCPAAEDSDLRWAPGQLCLLHHHWLSPFNSPAAAELCHCSWDVAPAWVPQPLEKPLGASEVAQEGCHRAWASFHTKHADAGNAQLQVVWQRAQHLAVTCRAFVNQSLFFHNK